MKGLVFCSHNWKFYVWKLTKQTEVQRQPSEGIATLWYFDEGFYKLPAIYLMSSYWSSVKYYRYAWILYLTVARARV